MVNECVHQTQKCLKRVFNMKYSKWNQIDKYRSVGMLMGRLASEWVCQLVGQPVDQWLGKLRGWSRY